MARLVRAAVLGIAACGAVAGVVIAQPPPDLLGEIIQNAPPPAEPPASAQIEAPPPAAADVPAAGSIVTTPPPPVDVKVDPTTPPPEAEAKVKAKEEPSTRARFPIALVQVVDKVTAETTRFEVRLDRPVQFQSLIFTVRACEAQSTANPARGAVAHVQVDFQPPTAQGRARPASRTLFRGWMYADSPSLSPLEHPVYDAWLIACRAS